MTFKQIKIEHMSNICLTQLGENYQDSEASSIGIWGLEIYIFSKKIHADVSLLVWRQHPRAINYNFEFISSTRQKLFVPLLDRNLQANV